MNQMVLGVMRLEKFINNNNSLLIMICVALAVLMFLIACICYIKAFHKAEPRYLRITASAILTVIALIALILLIII